jgi:hypothetical protein
LFPVLPMASTSDHESKMIKAKSKNKLMIGLSERNIEHMKKGLGMYITADEFHSEDIVIFLGENDETMYSNLEKFMEPNVKIVDRRPH